jgi:hypothetical protein
MFGWKPRWLRHGEHLINLDHINCFETNQQDKDAVTIFFNGSPSLCVLHGVTIADIHYFLKHGKLRKREAAK